VPAESAVATDLVATYDAFISYSRRDAAFTRELHRRLEAFSPPSTLPLPKRRLKVFHDEGDLSGTEYFQTIDRFLRASSTLIVVCSPASRASAYVNDEIRRFIAARGTDRIVSILLAGVPNNEARPDQDAEKAFPDALCQAIAVPLAVDYRRFDLTRDHLTKGTFGSAWYGVLANVYGVDAREIEQRDQRRQAKRRRILAAVVSAVILALSATAAVALLARAQAARERDVAVSERGRADRNAEDARQRQAEAERQRHEADVQRQEADRRRRDAILRVAEIRWNNGVRARQDGASLKAAYDFIVAAENYAAAGDLEAARNAQLASDALLGDYQLTAIVPAGSGWISHIQPLQTRREFLAWTGSSSVVRVWARSDGRPVTPPLTHPQLWTAGYTAHEDRLLTWGADMRVRVWRNGRLSRTLEIDKPSPSMTVRGAAVSPDGRLALVVTGDIAINSSYSEGYGRVWDLDTGRPVTGPLKHDHTVTGGTFSHDGTRVLTWSRDGTARLWDARTGAARVAPLPLPGEVVGGLFSTDDSRIITWGGSQGEGQARIWDARDGKAVGASMTQHAGIAGAALSGDGARLLTWSGEGISNSKGEGEARLWDAATGAAIGGPMTHQGDTVARFNPDDTAILTWSLDGTARVWDAASAQPVTPPMPHGAEVADGGWRRDGVVVTLARDGRVREWDGRTGVLIGVHLLDQQPFAARAFADDMDTVMIGGRDGVVRVWTKRRADPLAFGVHHDKIQGAASSPSGRLLATWGESGVTRIWDCATARQVAAIAAEPRDGWRVWGVAFSPDDSHVAISSWMYRGLSAGSARVWRVRDGRAAGPPVIHRDLIVGVAFSPDGRAILTWSSDRTAKLSDVATGAALAQASSAQRSVLAAGFDGDTAITFDGQRLRAWDRRGREARDPPLGWHAEGEESGFHYIVRGGRRLTWNTSDPGPVRFVDVDGHTTAIAPPRGESLRSAALSPDGRLIALGLVGRMLKDGRAVTYDSRSGRSLVAVPHGNDVTALAFAPDGSRLMTWGGDVARTWDARSGAAVGATMAVAGSYVTSPIKGLLVTFGTLLRFWDTATTDAITGPIDLVHAVEGGVFTEDGSRLLVSGWNGATLFDSRGHELVQVWRTQAEPDGFHRNAVGEQARRFVHWENNGTVLVFNLTPEAVPLDARLHDRFAALTGARFDDFDGLQRLGADEWSRAKASAYDSMRISSTSKTSMPAGAPGWPR